MRHRLPIVPFSPSTGQVLEPAGQSMPLSSPTNCPTPLITPNPTFSQPQSLEWDHLAEQLVGNIVGRRDQLSIPGIGRLEKVTSKKVSATNPNLLEEEQIAIVSTESSSLEVTLGEVFYKIGNIWEEDMANEDLRNDLAQAKEAEKDVRYAIADFTVDDVFKSRLRIIDNELSDIWDQVNQFRYMLCSI